VSYCSALYWTVLNCIALYCAVCNVKHRLYGCHCSDGCSALVQPVVVNVGRAGAANLDVIQEVEMREAGGEGSGTSWSACRRRPPPCSSSARTRPDVDDIRTSTCSSEGVEALAVHGGKEQEERQSPPSLRSRLGGRTGPSPPTSPPRGLTSLTSRCALGPPGLYPPYAPCAPLCLSLYLLYFLYLLGTLAMWPESHRFFFFFFLM